MFKSWSKRYISEYVGIGRQASFRPMCHKGVRFRIPLFRRNIIWIYLYKNKNILHILLPISIDFSIFAVKKLTVV